MVEIKGGVEAVLFTSDEPISITKLQQIVEGATPQKIKEALGELKSEYETTNRAFAVEEIADGYQILTKTQYKSCIEKLKKAKAEERLSSAALETLSIIAYKQPIKRVDIESVRGVQSGQLIRALMEKDLVKIAGRE